MLVGICGTHGTGKSTLLRGAKDSGCVVNESQLSRTAQAALGWDKLSRAQESVENMWALQEAILVAMYDRDEAIERMSNIQHVTLVDRTPADVWAYTEMWCNRLGIDCLSDVRARSYKQQCREMAKRYARFLIVPINSQIKFVEEPNRADASSRVFVQQAIENFIFDGGLTYAVIKNADKDDRISEVIFWTATTEAQLKGLNQ